uniref:Uncharacterized protein n=1 Tax=Fagus sylvatica TaxID=28930 RepID=A0A2N9IIK0_FAGSY
MKGDSVLKSGRGVRGGQVAEAVGKALLLPEDMKVWQEKRSKHMLENLQARQPTFGDRASPAGNRLLETERRLSAEEIKRLKDLESSASVRIRAAESAQKSAEAGLLNLQNQVAELQRKLDSERKSASQVRIENSQLKDALTEAEAKASATSISSKDGTRPSIVPGLMMIPDLYDLAYTRQPYEDPVPEEGNELEADMPDDQIHAAESQEGGEGSDVDETIDVVD